MMEKERKEEKYSDSQPLSENRKSRSKIWKQYIIIIAVLLVLSAAAGMLVKLNTSDVTAVSGQVAVIYEGQQAASFDLDAVKAMNSVEIKKHIESGSGEDEDGVFTGTDLSSVIEAAGIELTGKEKDILIRTQDGFTASFEPEEVMADSCVLLVYEKDGRPLGSMEEGGNGPFRIIAADDAFGMRCAKYVTAIEVE